MSDPARTREQRTKDTLTKLEQDVDCWVATADKDSGTPYLVPLSFLWDGAAFVVSTPAASPTSRNLQATGKARISPVRIQAWREANELRGRDLMRGGEWLSG